MLDTSRVAGILAAIKAGYGFKNIASPSVTALTSITIPDVATLTALATSQAGVTGLAIPDTNTLTAARTAIIAAQSQASYYSTHVSGISGVNLIGEPNFVTMAKIAQAAHDINGEKDYTSEWKIFGGIMNSASVTKATTDFAALTSAFLTNIPLYAATMPTKASTFTSLLSTQIATDNDAYSKAKLTVAQFSSAANLVSLYDDPGINPVLMTIMTDQLKTEVIKASVAAKKKNTTTIYDDDNGNTYI